MGGLFSYVRLTLLQGLKMNRILLLILAFSICTPAQVKNATTPAKGPDMKLTDSYAKAALLASKAMRDRSGDTEKLLREADVETTSEGDRLTFALLNASQIYMTTNDLNKRIIRSRTQSNAYRAGKNFDTVNVAYDAVNNPDYQNIEKAEQACFSALDKMFRSRVGDIGLFSEGECSGDTFSPKLTADAPAASTPVKTPAASLHSLGESFADFLAKEPLLQQDIDHCKAAKKRAQACKEVLVMPTRMDRFTFRLAPDTSAPTFTFDGGKLAQMTPAP
jgi:hypothetical protein